MYSFRKFLIFPPKNLEKYWRQSTHAPFFFKKNFSNFKLKLSTIKVIFPLCLLYLMLFISVIITEQCV